jgi:hypothetical protein
MDGEVGILNVGAGDVKLNFNSKDPAEVIRAGRIVSDMLRRGYALLVIDKNGTARRAVAFDDKTEEYLIADYDPTPQGLIANERQGGTKDEESPAKEEQASPPAKRNGRRRVKAKSVRAVAVARTAGG